MRATPVLVPSATCGTIALVLAAVAAAASGQSNADRVHAAGVTLSMQLNAVIAEVGSSPFHIGVRPADLWADDLQRIAHASVFEADGGRWRNQETPPDSLASSVRLFAAATGVGLLAYPVGAFVFYWSYGSASPGSGGLHHLALGMAIPVAAVGMTAMGMGADPLRATLGSMLGGGMGLAVWSLASDHQPLIGLALGSVAHAAVTTIAARIHFRKRPQS